MKLIKVSVRLLDQSVCHQTMIQLAEQSFNMIQVDF